LNLGYDEEVVVAVFPRLPEASSATSRGLMKVCRTWLAASFAASREQMRMDQAHLWAWSPIAPPIASRVFLDFPCGALEWPAGSRKEQKMYDDATPVVHLFWVEA